MNEAEELKILIRQSISDIEHLQRRLTTSIGVLASVRSDVLLFSIRETNMNTNSASRIISAVGGEWELDLERLGQVRRELQEWMARL